MANIRFEDVLERELEDAEFRAEYERLKPAFEVAKLRALRGLTQKELAQMVGTWQSSIARLESGKKEPSLPFLRRVLEALDAQLEIRIITKDTVAVEQENEITIEQKAAPTITVFWQGEGIPELVPDWTDRQLIPIPTGDMITV
jgi:transcriptional regulator with XRE-family HTH domain